MESNHDLPGKSQGYAAIATQEKQRSEPDSNR